MEAKEYGYGFDAQNGVYGDLVKLGIIDPTKVVRTALQDAASIAGCRHHRGDDHRGPQEGLAADAGRPRRHGRHGFLNPRFASRQNRRLRLFRGLLFYDNGRVANALRRGMTNPARRLGCVGNCLQDQPARLPSVARDA